MAILTEPPRQTMESAASTSGGIDFSLSEDQELLRSEIRRVPEEYGGAGLDALTYCIAMEEIARVCPATAVTMSVTNSVCCWPIVRFGSEELKRRVLPPLATGEAIGGFGLTEPGAGSD